MSSSQFSISRLHRRPPSPKQAPGNQPLYPYYAGYSDAFVQTLAEHLDAKEGILLDPWNGAGTTTAAASASGIASIGIDLNPASLVIARARLLSSEVVESLRALTDEVISNVSSVKVAQVDGDPLQAWFAPRSVVTLRAIERSINRLLVDSEAKAPGDLQAINSSFSSLASLYYVALFRTVRRYMKDFRTTNPTWLHKSSESRKLLTVPRHELIRAFRAEMGSLEEKVRQLELRYDGKCPATLKLGSSEKLALSTNEVDGIITSPPYCTRIDYVVSTGPELAVLGLGREAIRNLRGEMLGTPLMNRSIWKEAFSDEYVGIESERAVSLLRYVKAHKSHGSANYYHPFFAQYFYGVQRSLREIARVSKTTSPAIFVVQDSYFKKKRIDLASILREMGEARDWHYLRSFRYQVRSRAMQNPLSRRYGRRTATETVLIFTT